MRCRGIAAALVCMAALAGAGGGARAETVDLLLVLAADVSRSIDDDEFNLQRKGYANAITDPEVLSAIIGGKHHAIAVTFVEWSGADEQKIVVDWTVVRDGEAAAGDRLDDHVGAALICRPHRDRRGDRLRGSATAGAPGRAERRVIDVSGDGTSNSGRPVTEARDEAVAGRHYDQWAGDRQQPQQPGIRVPYPAAGRTAEILQGQRDRRSRRVSDHGRGFPQLRRRDHPQAGQRDRRDSRGVLAAPGRLQITSTREQRCGCATALTPALPRQSA